MQCYFGTAQNLENCLYPAIFLFYQIYVWELISLIPPFVFWVVLLVAKKKLHSSDVPAIVKTCCTHASVNLLLFYLLCNLMSVKVKLRSDYLH